MFVIRMRVPTATKTATFVTFLIAKLARFLVLAAKITQSVKNACSIARHVKKQPVDLVKRLVQNVNREDVLVALRAARTVAIESVRNVQVHAIKDVEGLAMNVLLRNVSSARSQPAKSASKPAKSVRISNAKIVKEW